MGKRRTRQHVNPLNFRREVDRPDWAAVFPDASRPLEVEVGCSKGTFLLARAKQAPDRNLVGLEIREPIAARATAIARESGLTNVHVICANANVSFSRFFDPASIDRVYVHFPDPWFKTRHHKRRVLTPSFVELLASRLKPSGELHFMTDYATYAASARALIEAHPAFRNRHGAGVPAPGPMVEVLSDREAHHLARGDPVYRYLFERASKG